MLENVIKLPIGAAMLREPRREDYVTWTAVAPGLVFTVLAYGTRQLYGPSGVRKSGAQGSPVGRPGCESKDQGGAGEKGDASPDDDSSLTTAG
jgi:hypothetical protein